MCGIFGIITHTPTKGLYQIILDGLVQLQNRGYDSSGVYLMNHNNSFFYKYASTPDVTSIEKLRQHHIEDATQLGIGHNRWATHGGKTDINAHPHISNSGRFVIVHNGIIENYQIIKDFLIKNGYTFYSQTDTEVIVNLLSYHFEHLHNTFESIKKTIEELEGTYGIIIIDTQEANTLYCVRNGSPLLIGYNDEEAIITSEQSGFCGRMNTYITLQNDDICVIHSDRRIIVTTMKDYVHRNVTLTHYDVTPNPYPHWTLKEIFEQPTTIQYAINRGGRIKNDREVKLGGLETYQSILKDIQHIILLGCGTSYHAGLYGMYYLKHLCEFHTVQLIDGADFTSADIPRHGNTALVLISQSGETRDLYRCMALAKEHNLPTIGIINVVDSLIAREVTCGIYCNAGREMGVASTKAFTSQVVCLSLLAIWFSQLHEINEWKRIEIIRDLRNLSHDITTTIHMTSHSLTENIIQTMARHSNLFLLGKGTDECIAREGSLKIKEISYIHSEAYSASSLKHGPFALLDEHFPVILMNCHEEHTAKMMNCLEEVHSRQSPILLITNQECSTKACHVLNVVKNNSYASLLGIIPLQLLAYHVSVHKQINPDIPKNLAKVVTVE